MNSLDGAIQTYLKGLVTEDLSRSNFARRRPEYRNALEGSQDQADPDGYRALLEYLNNDQETISPTKLIEAGYETATRKILSMMERRRHQSISAVSNSEIEARVNRRLEAISWLPHSYRYRICEELFWVLTNPSSMGEAGAAEGKVSSVRRIFNNHQIQAQTIRIHLRHSSPAGNPGFDTGQGEGQSDITISGTSTFGAPSST